MPGESNPFDLTDVARARRPAKQHTLGELWLVHFTATLCGFLVASVILGLGVRFYLRWSVQDTIQQMEERERRLKAETPPPFPGR